MKADDLLVEWRLPAEWFASLAHAYCSAWWRGGLRTCEHATEPSRGNVVLYDPHTGLVRCVECSVAFWAARIATGPLAVLSDRVCAQCGEPASRVVFGRGTPLSPGFQLIAGVCHKHGPVIA